MIKVFIITWFHLLVKRGFGKWTSNVASDFLLYINLQLASLSCEAPTFFLLGLETLCLSTISWISKILQQ